MRLYTLFLIFIISVFTGYANADDIIQIKNLRAQADSLHSVGKTDSAAIIGQKAINLAKKLGSPTQIVGTNATQGVFLRSQGKIDEALNCYNRALEIITSGAFRSHPSQEDIEEIASLYINLAVLNLDMQQKEAAASNAVTAGQWIAKSNDPELRSTIYGVVGSVLTGCGDLSIAMDYQNLAYQDALISDNPETAFRAAAYAMLAADRLDRRDLAQTWRDRCTQLLPKIDSVMAKLVYYQAECSICLKRDDKREALHWFKKILDTEGIEQLPFIKYDCYNNMHIAYAGLGDYQKAYETLLQGNQLRDSIQQREKTESLRELTVKYETKEKELALAESQARQARTLNWLFATIAALLAVAVIFTVYAEKNRRKRILRETEFANLRADVASQLTRQYIDGLENERLRMSKELHDGVCNDLLAIQLNLNEGVPIEKSMRMINDCRESVRRISHELMPPEFSYATLNEVIQFLVLKQSEANPNIDFSFKSEIAEDKKWSQISDQTALEIYRIAQEAIGNAVKHSGADCITVALDYSSDGLTLDIRDNGHFIDNTRQGLGIKSMKKRAESIDGDIFFNNTDNQNTNIILKVKI